MFLEISWLIFVIPLFVSPFVAILEYLKRYGGLIAAVISSATSFLISTGALIETLDGSTKTIAWRWIDIAGAPIQLGVYMDLLSAFMSFIVSLIGTLILIYSVQYMEHERGKRFALPRYYFEMTFFIASMLGLVLSYDLIQMYIFWEGVGLASYLLIGYWWNRPKAAKGAKEAFIYTRIGDTFFLMGIAYVFLSGQSSFTITAINEITGGAATIVSLCLFVGAIGKSAQLPLFPWLAEEPSAMQGPTTVSALIHAATMVKAGVFLVARFYPLFQQAAFPVLKVVAYVGGITSAFAGLVAIWKNDIKRVLGYSTISHLGFMFLALGVGAYTAGLFHLINHAIFKALLFLTSGAVLHTVHEVRDMQELGGLWEKMKITRWLGLIGALAISGVPPFNGFWSKEAVLAGINASGNPFLFFLGIIAAMASAFYIWRWFFLIFGGEPRSKEAKDAHEVSSFMTGPVSILAIGAIILGLLVEFTGISNIIPAAAHAVQHHAHLLPEYVVLGSSLGLIGLGIGLTYSVYQKKILPAETFMKNSFLRGFRNVFKNAWYFEDAYNYIGQHFIYEGASKLLDWIDRYIIDGIVQGIAAVALFFGEKIRRAQSGVVEHYVTTVLLGLALTLFSFVFWLVF